MSTIKSRKRRKLRVEWKEVDGALKQKKVLRLRCNERSEYVCPVETCLHTHYMSRRGLRKHINNIHTWFYYFDKQPVIDKMDLDAETEVVPVKAVNTSFTTSSGYGLQFMQWLQHPAGEDRS